MPVDEALGVVSHQLAFTDGSNAGVEVDEYQRGLIDYYAQSHQAAVDAFARYVDATPDYDNDAHYYAARSWLALGRPDRAVDECERALARTAAETHTADLPPADGNQRLRELETGIVGIGPWIQESGEAS